MKHILSQIFFNISIGSVIMLKQDYKAFKDDKTTSVLPLLKYKYKPKIQIITAINKKGLFWFSYTVENHMGTKTKISPFLCKEIDLPV